MFSRDAKREHQHRMRQATLPAANRESMPRYVVLEHGWNGIHYDLMLEQGSVLKTWRLEKPLTAGEQHVTQLPDHRLEYLTYEGPVSSDRGTVKRIAEGHYTLLQATDNSLKASLSGSVDGVLELTQLTETQWHTAYFGGYTLPPRQALST
jgi:hypothetical protein